MKNSRAMLSIAGAAVVLFPVFASAGSWHDAQEAPRAAARRAESLADRRQFLEARSILGTSLQNAHEAHAFIDPYAVGVYADLCFASGQTRDAIATFGFLSGQTVSDNAPLGLRLRFAKATLGTNDPTTINFCKNFVEHLEPDHAFWKFWPSGKDARSQALACALAMSQDYTGPTKAMLYGEIGLKLDPTNPVFVSNLASSYLAKKRYGAFINLADDAMPRAKGTSWESILTDYRRRALAQLDKQAKG